MSGSSLVKYGTYEVEAAQEEREALATTDGDYMKFGVGKNIVRFLPPAPGTRTPFITTWQHYLDVPGASGVVVVACPRLLAKKPCPICKRADELRRTGVPADRDQAWDIKAQRRVHANVVNRREPERGPVTVGFGKTIHDALIEIREDEDAGGDFTHPLEGFDIIVLRKGTGKNDTKYKVMGARRASALHDDTTTMNEWITTQPDLGHLTRALTPDEIKQRIRDAASGSSGGGSGKGSNKGSKGSSADDDITDADWTETGDDFKDDGDDFGW